MNLVYLFSPGFLLVLLQIQGVIPGFGSKTSWDYHDLMSRPKTDRRLTPLYTPDPDSYLLNTLPGRKCKTNFRIVNGMYRLRQRGAFVRFQCSYPYLVFGSNIAICVQGKWTHPPPICVRPGCRRVRAPANGSLKSLLGGGAAGFWCNEGYSMVGESLLACNGIAWNGTEPICVSVSRSTNSPHEDDSLELENGLNPFPESSQSMNEGDGSGSGDYENGEEEEEVTSLSTSSIPSSLVPETLPPTTASTLPPSSTTFLSTSTQIVTNSSVRPETTANIIPSSTTQEIPPSTNTPSAPTSTTSSPTKMTQYQSTSPPKTTTFKAPTSYTSSSLPPPTKPSTTLKTTRITIKPTQGSSTSTTTTEKATTPVLRTKSPSPKTTSKSPKLNTTKVPRASTPSRSTPKIRKTTSRSPSTFPISTTYPPITAGEASTLATTESKRNETEEFQAFDEGIPIYSETGSGSKSDEESLVTVKSPESLSSEKSGNDYSIVLVYLSYIGGTILFILLIVGGTIRFWRTHKGIARARSYDLDGRMLSSNFEETEDSVWIQHRESSDL